MQLVDGLLDLGQLALAPVEAGQRRAVRPVLGHAGAGRVEQLDEQLGGQQAEAAALRESDLGYLARDDHLVGPVGGRADDAQRLGRWLRHGGIIREEIKRKTFFATFYSTEIPSFSTEIPSFSTEIPSRPAEIPSRSARISL